MFSDDILDKDGDILLWGLDIARRARFKKSDLVLVRYDAAALPLAEVLVEKLHERGLVPVPRMERAFYLQNNRKRLLLEIPGERELYQQLAGSIRCIAPGAFGHLDESIPSCLASRNKDSATRSRFFRSANVPASSWTLGIYPTSALAAVAVVLRSGHRNGAARAPTAYDHDRPLFDSRAGLRAGRMVLLSLKIARVQYGEHDESRVKAGQGKHPVRRRLRPRCRKSRPHAPNSLFSGR